MWIKFKVGNVSTEMGEWWNYVVFTFSLHTLSNSFPLSNVGMRDLKDTLADMEQYTRNENGKLKRGGLSHWVITLVSGSRATFEVSPLHR